MEIVVKGNVRGISSENLPEDLDSKVVLNPRGEQVVAIGLPGTTELIRLGQSFYGTHATLVVALAGAVPTTVAGTALWNGEPPNGKTYLVTAITAHCGTSAGAATQATIFAALSNAPVFAVPATNDTIAARGLIAGRLYNGRAAISRTVTPTLVPVATTWFPFGKSFEDTVLTATVGNYVGGMLPEVQLVPPGHCIYAQVCAVNATMAFTYTYFWHEVQIPTL